MPSHPSCHRGGATVFSCRFGIALFCVSSLVFSKPCLFLPFFHKIMARGSMWKPLRPSSEWMLNKDHTTSIPSMATWQCSETDIPLGPLRPPSYLSWRRWVFVRAGMRVLEEQIWPSAFIWKSMYADLRRAACRHGLYWCPGWDSIPSFSKMLLL